MAKKRFRADLNDNSPEFLFFDAEVLDPKHVRMNHCLATSPSQLSCVSACDAPCSEHKSVGTCREEQVAIPSAALLCPAAIEWDAEAAHSTNGSCLASEEEELSEYVSFGTVGCDDSLTADPPHKPFLRRTLSRGAESCCGEDAQVDISCFLEDGDEGLYDLAYNSADVSQDHSYPILAECSDSVSTPCPDACGAEAAVFPDGDWFLSDLERDGQFLWNEELDEEWMTAAVANLDRINDTFDADASVLELLEAGPVF